MPMHATSPRTQSQTKAEQTKAEQMKVEQIRVECSRKRRRELSPARLLENAVAAVQAMVAAGMDDKSLRALNPEQLYEAISNRERTEKVRNAFDAVWELLPNARRLNLSNVRNSYLWSAYPISISAKRCGCRGKSGELVCDAARQFLAAWAKVCDALLAATPVPAGTTENFPQTVCDFLEKLRAWKSKDEARWRARLTVKVCMLYTEARFAASASARAESNRTLQEIRTRLLRRCGAAALREADEEGGFPDAEPPAASMRIRPLSGGVSQYEGRPFRLLLSAELCAGKYTAVRHALYDTVLALQDSGETVCPKMLSDYCPVLCKWSAGPGSRKTAIDSMFEVHGLLVSLETEEECKLFEDKWEWEARCLFSEWLTAEAVQTVLLRLQRRAEHVCNRLESLPPAQDGCSSRFT